jgi:hypothetical protein
MKTVIEFAALGACLGMLACAIVGSPEGKAAQVGTARAAQEVACAKHLRRFFDGRDEGLSCEASRARASAENPLCNLSFSCPSKEGGVE